MATRRTTMKSQSGTKLYAVRDETGKFEDIQTYKRAHTADMRQKSKAEKEAAQGPMERKVRKTASDAYGAVKGSIRGAVAAVERTAKRAVKTVSGSKPAAKKTFKKTAAKTTRKPAAKKTARKTARKRASKKT